MTKSSLVQYLRCSSPNNEATSRWRRFFVLLAVSGSAASVYPPNSGYPRAEAPYFDFELRFLVAAATRIEIQSRKWFVQHPMGQVWMKTTEIAVNNFVPRKDYRR